MEGPFKPIKNCIFSGFNPDRALSSTGINALLRTDENKSEEYFPAKPGEVSVLPLIDKGLQRPF
jgi:hypothetical protein